MKDVRFYLEFPSPLAKKYSGKTHEGHLGTVVAAINDPYVEDGTLRYEALASVYCHPDSPPATTSVTSEYLKRNCKRIPERLARTIHPQLFKRLDSEGA